MQSLVTHKDLDRGYNFIIRHQTFDNMVSDYPTIEIGKIPKDWRVDGSENGDKYKKFILIMDMEINRSLWVLYSKAKIIFKCRNEDNPSEISCTPCKNYINSEDKTIEFYFSITPKIYDEIESIRNGGDLEVYLSIEEMFLHPYHMSQLRPIKGGSMTTIYRDGYERYNHHMGPVAINYDTTTCSDCKLAIFRDDWAKKVIEPLGMGERFIIEIPCRFPDITDGEYDEKLEEMRSRLEDGIESLKMCNDEYNQNRDHVKCAMSIRRKPAEILHRLPHNTNPPGKSYKNYDYINVYKQFLIEKSGTGTKEISQKTLDNIFKIIDEIYDLSSIIAAHTYNKENKQFNYDPYIEDAQMVLGITSLIYYWMGKKFERAAIKQIAESETEGETEES